MVLDLTVAFRELSVQRKRLHALNVRLDRNGYKVVPACDAFCSTSAETSSDKEDCAASHPDATFTPSFGYLTASDQSVQSGAILALFCLRASRAHACALGQNVTHLQYLVRACVSIGLPA